MQTLADYLATFPIGVQRARVTSTLSKVYQDGAGTVTEAAIIERAVASGNATLTYRCGTGKKRDGMRLPTKPKWTIWSGDSGTDISKTGATFANWLLAQRYDLEAIAAKEDAAYAREIAASKPMKGW